MHPWSWKLKGSWQKPCSPTGTLCSGSSIFIPLLFFGAMRISLLGIHFISVAFYFWRSLHCKVCLPVSIHSWLSVFFLDFQLLCFTYFLSYACVGVRVRGCRCLRRPETSDSPRAGVRGDSEQWTLELWVLGHLSSPAGLCSIVAFHHVLLLLQSSISAGSLYVLESLLSFASSKHWRVWVCSELRCLVGSAVGVSVLRSATGFSFVLPPGLGLQWSAESG